jgi:hypothetical protein
VGLNATTQLHLVAGDTVDVAVQVDATGASTWNIVNAATETNFFGKLILPEPIAPSITTTPVSQSITLGGSVTFISGASGYPAPSYQWTKGGTPITGAILSYYAIPSVAYTDAGTYYCVATNTAGTATSAGAVLTVTAP